MIDEKEAWETSNPDMISAMSYRTVKRLRVACQWYAQQRSKYSEGFKTRAELLSKELDDRKHDRTIIIGWTAAIVSIISAIVSWLGTLFSIFYKP